MPQNVFKCLTGCIWLRDSDCLVILGHSASVQQEA